MPTRIAPGVSDVLSSTMDMMPTIAALAGASLPATHTYDGMDLAPVLFRNASTHHPYLFHPGGGGELDTGRFGNIKVYWKARGTKACGDGSSAAGDAYSWVNAEAAQEAASTGGDLLAVDLSLDPGEEKNITLSAEQVVNFSAIRDSVYLSINSTFRSSPDYSQGTIKSDQPCCDVDHVVCRCTD